MLSLYKKGITYNYIEYHLYISKKKKKLHNIEIQVIQGKTEKEQRLGKFRNILHKILFLLLKAILPY